MMVRNTSHLTFGVDTNAVFHSIWSSLARLRLEYSPLRSRRFRQTVCHLPGYIYRLTVRAQFSHRAPILSARAGHWGGLPRHWSWASVDLKLTLDSANYETEEKLE